MTVTICVYADPKNDPKMLGDAEIQRTGAAIVDWANRDVAPAWSQGQYAYLFVPRGHVPPNPTDHLWHFMIGDTTDVQGAGGYHDIDGAGNPYAKVFAGDASRAGYPWSVILAHELAETMVDRFVDSCVLAGYQQGYGAYFMEVGDPFEAGPSYQHLYNGQAYAVCNYALPRYFKPWFATGPFDRLGLGQRALTPTAGGRQTVFVVNGNPITFDSAGNATEADPDDARVSRFPASGALPAELLA